MTIGRSSPQGPADICENFVSPLSILRGFFLRRQLYIRASRIFEYITFAFGIAVKKIVSL